MATLSMSLIGTLSATSQGPAAGERDADYYWVLNVPKNVTLAALQNAYVLRCDGLAEAYAVLRDDKIRTRYDEALQKTGSNEFIVDYNCTVCHGALKSGQYCPACGQHFADFFNLVFHLYMESRIETAKLSGEPVSFYIDLSEVEFWDALDRFPRDYQQRFGVALLPFAVDGEILAELDNVADGPGKNKFAFGASLGSLFDASFRLDGGLPDQLKRPKVSILAGPSVVYPAPLPDKPQKPYRDVNVSWGYKHGARKEILYFVLEMREAADKHLPYTVLYKGPATSTVVQGLRPSATYNFRVAGVNGEGLGPFSIDTQFLIPNDLPATDIHALVGKSEEKKRISSNTKESTAVAQSSVLLPSGTSSGSSPPSATNRSIEPPALNARMKAQGPMKADQLPSEPLEAEEDASESGGGKRRKRRNKTQKLEDELMQALEARNIRLVQDLMKLLSNGDYVLSTPTLMSDARIRLAQIEAEIQVKYVNIEEKLRIIKSLTAALESADPEELERAIEEAQKIEMPNPDDQKNLMQLLKEGRQVVKMIQMRERVTEALESCIKARDIQGLMQAIEEAAQFNIGVDKAKKYLKRLQQWRQAADLVQAVLEAKALPQSSKIAEAIEAAKKVIDVDEEMTHRVDQLQRLYATSLSTPAARNSKASATTSASTAASPSFLAIQAKVEDALKPQCKDSQKVINAIVAASSDEKIALSLQLEIGKLNEKLDILLADTPKGPAPSTASASGTNSTVTPPKDEFITVAKKKKSEVPAESDRFSKVEKPLPVPEPVNPKNLPTPSGPSWSTLVKETVPPIVVSTSSARPPPVSANTSNVPISKEFFPPLPGPKASTNTSTVQPTPAPTVNATSTPIPEVTQADKPVPAAAPKPVDPAPLPANAVKAAAPALKSQPTSLAELQTPKGQTGTPGKKKQNNKKEKPKEAIKEAQIKEIQVELDPEKPKDIPAPEPMISKSKEEVLPTPKVIVEEVKAREVEHDIESEKDSLAEEVVKMAMEISGDDSDHPSLPSSPSPLSPVTPMMSPIMMMMPPIMSAPQGFGFPYMSQAMLNATQWVASLNLPSDVPSSLEMLNSTDSELSLLLDSQIISQQKLLDEERAAVVVRESRSASSASAELKRERFRRERVEEAERTFRATAKQARSQRLEEMASQNTQALAKFKRVFKEKETLVIAQNAEKRRRDREEFERRCKEEDAQWAREAEERRVLGDKDWEALRVSLEEALKERDAQLETSQMNAWKALQAEILRKDTEDQGTTSSHEAEWTTQSDNDLIELRLKLESSRSGIDETRAKLDQLHSLQATFKQMQQYQQQQQYQLQQYPGYTTAPHTLSKASSPSPKSSSPISRLSAPKEAPPGLDVPVTYDLSAQTPMNYNSYALFGHPPPRPQSNQNFGGGMSAWGSLGSGFPQSDQTWSNTTSWGINGGSGVNPAMNVNVNYGQGTNGSPYAMPMNVLNPGSMGMGSMNSAMGAFGAGNPNTPTYSNGNTYSSFRNQPPFLPYTSSPSPLNTSPNHFQSNGHPSSAMNSQSNYSLFSNSSHFGGTNDSSGMLRFFSSPNSNK